MIIKTLDLCNLLVVGRRDLLKYLEHMLYEYDLASDNLSDEDLLSVDTDGVLFLYHRNVDGKMSKFRCDDTIKFTEETLGIGELVLLNAITYLDIDLVKRAVNKDYNKAIKKFMTLLMWEGVCYSEFIWNIYPVSEYDFKEAEDKYYANRHI